MATSTRTTPKTRSVLIERRGDEPLIVEGIPVNAKITYGPVQPGKASYDSQNALRIYTAANNQLGVFLNVVSFRDLDLTVKERKTTKKVREDAERGPDGEFSKKDLEVSFEWVEVQA